MAKSSINMLEGSIWDKVLMFAIPLAATSILQQLFNAADVAVVGQFVGAEALAAVGANGIVINLMVNLFVGLSIGTNVVCANMLGAKNYLRVKQAVHTSMVVAIVSGIAIAAIGVIFARDILIYLDTPADILDLAILYLQIIMAGMPFFMLYNFSSAILRSKGDTRRPLIAMVISGIVNVLLNLFFVAKLHMNVEGVALATAISSAVSSSILLYHLIKEKGMLQLRWQKLYVDCSISAFRHIARVGLPAGIQGMAFSVSNIVVQIALNNLGSTVVAATAAALNYEFFMFFIMSSFAQACSTFVGQNFGARNISRCKQIIKCCLIMNVAVTGIGSLICVIFAVPLVSVFTNDPDVIYYAAIRVRYIISLEIINVVMETLSGAMRGFNYSLQPAIICIMGICVFRVIFIYTYFPEHSSFEVLMALYPISWTFTVIGVVIAYLYVIKKLERRCLFQNQ